RPPYTTLRPYTTLFRSSGDLHAEKHEPAGTLRVAVPVNTMYRWLATALNQFQLRYPKIDLDIRMSNWVIDVGEQAIDLAIRVGRSEEHTSELQSRENLV